VTHSRGASPLDQAILDRAEQVPGWFPREPDMRVLYTLASSVVRPQGMLLEVGSWKGRSSYLLAAVAKAAGARLVCVDTWAGYPDRDHRLGHILAEARSDDRFIRHIRANLAEFGVASVGEYLAGSSAWAEGITVVLDEGISWEQARFWADGALDLVFLDGDHDSPGFDRDIDAYWPKLRRGGLLAGHDYGHAEYGDVRSVVDQAAVTRFGNLQVEEPIWWAAKGPA